MQTACSNGDYLYDPFSSDMINIAKARVLTSLIDHERLDYFNSTSNWYIENKQWCTLFSDLWYEISEMFHYNKHFSLTGLYLMNSLVNNYKNGYKLKLRGENECKEALMHTYHFVWRQSTWQILITLITLPLKPQMQSLLYYCCQKTHLSILMRINKIRKRSSVDLGSWFLTCKMKDYLA
ncbi:Protein GrpE [Trichinella pseudospiralis]